MRRLRRIVILIMVVLFAAVVLDNSRALEQDGYRGRDASTGVVAPRGAP